MQEAIKLASAAPARHFLTLILQLVLVHWYSISCSFIYNIYLNIYMFQEGTDRARLWPVDPEVQL